MVREYKINYMYNFFLMSKVTPIYGTNYLHLSKSHPIWFGSHKEIGILVPSLHGVTDRRLIKHKKQFHTPFKANV